MNNRFIRNEHYGWRWIYTPFRLTAFFGAGGWIYLSPTWLWEKGRAEVKRRA